MGSSRNKYITITFLLILASISFIRTAVDVLKSSKRLEDVEGEISALEAKKTGLERDVTYKGTTDYVEDRARTDLSMLKRGERFMVLLGRKSPVVPTQPSDSADVLPAYSARGAENTFKTSDNIKLWYKLFFDN